MSKEELNDLIDLKIDYAVMDVIGGACVGTLIVIAIHYFFFS
jgi:hypothetical protein